MRTSRGSHSEPTNSREIREVRKLAELALRRTTEMPKMPKPVAPSGGGIVDQARVWTTAVYPSFAGLKWPAGRSDIDWAGTTYQAPYSAMTGNAVDWLTLDGANIRPTQPGWYHAWCYARLVWTSQAGAPGAGIKLYLNGPDQPDGPHHPISEQGLGYWGVQTYIDNGIDYMTTSDFWRIEGDGLAAAGADVAQSNAIWKITRYG